ncbi:MAG TPA: DUF2959 domain-containing protein [Phycisphaerales bacterium]|nr:DNA repair protein [Phycisphaerae bacterium]HCT44885.1 DUF2959 domain-containing protein [Phycisphaerales bacterium]
MWAWMLVGSKRWWGWFVGRMCCRRIRVSGFLRRWRGCGAEDAGVGCGFGWFGIRVVVFRRHAMRTRSGVRTMVLFMVLVGLGLPTIGCSSTGIAIREKLGTPKREQLVDRVDETRDAQESAKEQFASTLDELKSLSGYDGGELESAYKRLNSQLERAKSRAERVSDKIVAVDRVANALFNEWEDELDEYATESLRNASARQLDQTRQRFGDVLYSMRKAEGKMGPVLDAFNDQVLFLKHNLNARAIASLDSTLGELEGEIASLIADMEASIDEANAFIDEMSGERQ